MYSDKIYTITHEMNPLNLKNGSNKGSIINGFYTLIIWL